MKIKEFAIVVLFLLIGANTVFSQVMYKQNLTENKITLSKGEGISLPLKSFLLVDFEIGSEGNFYISNLFMKEIIMLSNTGNKIKSIRVDESFFKGYEYTTMDIDLDEDNNVYCLLTKNGNFVNLLFVDIETEAVSEVTLNEIIEGRIRRFVINGDGNLYFNTFPWVIDYFPGKKKANYVYNAEGVLLNTTNYFIVPQNGKRYLIQSDSDISTIEAYSPNNNTIGNINKSASLRKASLVKEVAENGIRKYNWVYVGSDNESNIYLTNAEKINVFDEDLNTIEVFRYDSQIPSLNNAATNYQSLRISPNGSIYSVFVSPKNNYIKENYEPNEVVLNIVKLRDGGTK